MSDEWKFVPYVGPPQVEVDFTYVYNPKSEEPWFHEGVTPGYIVIRDGWLPDGEAVIADVVALSDGDGVIFEQTSEFRPTTIVDEMRKAPPS